MAEQLLTEGETHLVSLTQTRRYAKSLRHCLRRTAEGEGARRLLVIAIFAVFLLGPFMVISPLPSVGGPVAPTSVGTETVTAANVTYAASPLSAFVGQKVTFYLNVTSTIPSANITVTIFFDSDTGAFGTRNPKSAFSVNVTGNPGYVVQNYTYQNVGNFSGPDGRPFFFVRYYVSDGSVNYTTFAQEYVTINNAPMFYSPPPDPLTTNAGELVFISIMIADWDSDIITVTWDFGDGTTATNITAANMDGVYVNITHTWDPRVPGDKGGYNRIEWLNVTLNDGFTEPQLSSTIVDIAVPLNLPPSNFNVQASESEVWLDEPVVITASASDPEGDSLTWTYDFSDGSLTQVNHTAATPPYTVVAVNATHSFSVPGNHTINVTVSDYAGNTVALSTVIEVLVNQPPGVAANLSLNPSSPEINATRGYVNVSISIDANDPDGDNLTVTWNLADGQPARVNVSTGGKQVFTFTQWRIFTETGDYNLSATVTDNMGHTVIVYKVVTVSSNNLPPSLQSLNFPYGGNATFAVAGQVLNFTLVLSDPEHDVLAITWDFGDGSALLNFTLSDYTGNNVTFNVSHAYAKVGKYTVTIFYTDNKIGLLNHTKFINATVTVDVPRVIKIVKWDWWDYTSLTIVGMIPVAIAARFYLIDKRRKRLEEEGISLDEAKLRKEMHLDVPGDNPKSPEQPPKDREL